MESNHRAQIRSLPLYPLSYGAGLTLSMPDVRPALARSLSASHLDDVVAGRRRRRRPEAGVHRVETIAEIVDRRRDVEVRIGQVAGDPARVEPGRQRDPRDLVVAVLDDVEDLAGEQDPVTVSHAVLFIGDLLVGESTEIRRATLSRHGGGSSVGRAPGCGPGGRGFESRPPPACFVGARRPLKGSLRSQARERA